MAISEKNSRNLATLSFVWVALDYFFSVAKWRKIRAKFYTKKEKKTLVCCLLPSPDKCSLSSNVYSYLSLVGSHGGMCVGS
jgi:hypothetical protein